MAETPLIPFPVETPTGLDFEGWWQSDGISIYRSVFRDDALLREICELSWRSALICADAARGAGNERSRK